MLTAERLRELLHYDPSTGIFTWRVRRCGRALVGATAGSLNADGYVHIRVDGGRYKAHRLAVLYMTGEWPVRDVDHENLCRSDNRWNNLRRATRSQNCANSRRPRNNTSGFKGVSWHGAGKAWVARVMVKGESRYLGLFDTPEAAHAAYSAAAMEAHGSFSRAA
jgi:hypothetical protein